MTDCQSIGIRWTKNDEELYKKFINAKKKIDKERSKRGEKPTSCAEFSKMLFYIALEELEKREGKLNK